VYLTDRQGSVGNLTDSSGNLQDTLTYDPFGNVLSESSGLTFTQAHPDGWGPAGGTLEVLPAVTGPDGSMEPGNLALPW
jgi:hypothetical protein